MSDWGSVNSPQQVGTPIKTRGGKQGTVIHVGEKVVKFVGPDGKLDAARINNVRPQQGSPLDQSGEAAPVVRPWGDVNKGDVGRVVEDRKGRRGIIFQVGRGGAIAARGADGKALGIPPGRGRIVEMPVEPSREEGRIDYEEPDPETSGDPQRVPSERSDEPTPRRLPQSAQEAIRVLEADAASFDREIAKIMSKLKQPGLTYPQKRALRMKKTRLEFQRERRARAIVAVPLAQRGRVKVANQVPASLKVVVQGALDLVSSYTHRDLLPQINIYEIPVGQRSGHWAGDILAARGAKVASLAHEVTHATERQNPEVLAAAVAFLKSRTQGETPKPLALLTGNPRYRADEYALEDKWKRLGGSHYCGKVCETGTELLTTGINRLHSNPLRFAREDPEYFSFVVKTLRRW